MKWQFVVALIVAIPLILFPAAFVWYLNLGGVYRAAREKLARRAARHDAKQKDAGGLPHKT
jgi:hypothetical protein